MDDEPPLKPDVIAESDYEDVTQAVDEVVKKITSLIA